MVGQPDRPRVKAAGLDTAQRLLDQRSALDMAQRLLDQRSALDMAQRLLDQRSVMGDELDKRGNSASLKGEASWSQASQPLLDVRLVAVGSTNPVKLAAVQAVIGQLWPAARVEALAVDPGVPVQPLSDEQMVAGAQARAMAARAALDADLGVGLEGGVQRSPWGLLLTGWVAVVDRSGRQGLGSGGRLPLPTPLAEAVLAGEELGPAVDRLAGQHDTRRGPGAVGILTSGLVRRDETFRVATAYAMARFLHPTWYCDGQPPKES